MKSRKYCPKCGRIMAERVPAQQWVCVFGCGHIVTQKIGCPFEDYFPKGGLIDKLFAYRDWRIKQENIKEKSGKR